MDRGRSKEFYEFGRFRVDPDKQLLLREERLVPLAPKTFETLLVLIRHSQEVVTKDELMKALWPDTFVEETNLSRNIFLLRKALGENAGTHHYIVTQPGRGYRFVEEVRVVPQVRPAVVVERHSRSEVVIELSKPSSQTIPKRGYRLVAPVPTSVSTPLFDSLAVLPLVNATGDPETEYLSDGISESIINLLSQFPNLRVIPRASAFRYKGREADFKTVGHDLRVRAVLTGKLIQRGDKLVVQTELVDVANDAQIWGGQFNRKLDDIFEVQEELARQIAEKLRLRLTPEEKELLTKRPTQNREVYQLLLKAQYQTNKWTTEGVRQGMDYARQVIEADPGCAAAYAWMAFTYVYLPFYGSLPCSEAYPKAKAAALKALEIDENLTDAHTALGAVQAWYDWDWVSAERSLKRALELNPNYAWAHFFYSFVLFWTQRHQEALAEVQRSVELDPLTANFSHGLAYHFYLARDYDLALSQFQKTLELDPNFVYTRPLLSRVYSEKGMHEEAIQESREVVCLLRGAPYGQVNLGLAWAKAGKPDEARKILDELTSQGNLDNVSEYLVPVLHAILGNKDKAFEMLEKAYEQRNMWLLYLSAPIFDSLRDDPRFANLCHRIGLVEPVSTQTRTQLG